ncbi:Cysteine-rich RLK (Receptor-like kinase) protein [Quillaja saponaria]|uniref:Cysteine-rich RLK (Receptor-like kinase) protein n=1 Tax=Quillaja saponaria TaxID=32244 RepID=A0AAD7QDQ7_QUISA|nr:Cysteine-rich RLK (Receptor-like kinase) protein [Quillaja saponaria]
MINKSSSRESFIESSIQTARLHGFQGLDLCEVGLSSATDMTNLGTLFNEWRAAVTSEARSSSMSELLLVMAGKYLPALDSVSYPIESMLRNLDWVHLVTYDYYIPRKDNVTGLHAPLYGPPGRANTDYGIKEWKRRGFVYRKLVLGLPYHGFAWTLVNPNNNSVGVPASGPAFTQDGSMAYKLIKSFIRSFGNGADSEYKATYVVNLFTVATTWINFDDVEAIKTKVSYAKNNGLLGYNVFQVGNDDNWVLSQAALEEHINHDRRRLLIIILIATSMVILLLGTIMCYLQSRVLKSRELSINSKSICQLAGNTDRNCSDPQVYKYSTIRVATNNFSDENKIGEGGFGTVYKGKLRKGQDIAVKRLSKTSNQGLEEFKNEVTLTARLQHVNLVDVLGYCTEREEKMLIYELMPNKSLDLYLFDPNREILLDWTKRVNIIEGVTQGLLYLQEYSKFTIVHRDIKSGKMNLKQTQVRIVGTYGYVPPEYVRKGIYSMKYDVYSFGVLLLQIISGKRSSCYYGTYKNLNLLEYAYELWKQGKGKEFIDPSLDDSTSHCKIMRCMQVALLCVQENPVDRPSMLDVSSMLKNEIAAISTPKKPAFSIKRDEEEEEEETCMLGVKFSSLNDVTISQVEPR